MFMVRSAFFLNGALTRRLAQKLLSFLAVTGEGSVGAFTARDIAAWGEGVCRTRTPRILSARSVTLIFPFDCR
jgi:hypothetical protein